MATEYCLKHAIILVCCCCRHHPSTDNSGGVQLPSLRILADDIPPSSRHPDPLVDWWSLHLTRRFHGNRTQIRDLWCVFMLVQLNNCVVVCDSDLQRGYSGDGCLSSSILFKYESSMGHFWFVVVIVCHDQVRRQVSQGSRS